MSGPFRSELEATRARADALEEENEDLRDEVVRLRVRPPNAGAEAPAIAKLGEDALARLDEMAEAIALDPPAREHVAPPRPPADSDPPERSADALRRDLRDLHRANERLRMDRDRVASGGRTSKVWFYRGLFVGLAVGGLIGALVAVAGR